jgi:hypothetical protein
LLFAVLPLVILGYFGWFYYGADHLDQALYALRAENMQTTPQPNWIKSNVADEVFTNGRLDRISLLDPRANAAIAQAFETHNWVKSVTRVTKSVGGSVVVDVIYRQPAAMVYYEKETVDPATREVTEASQGFFPIDEEGTVLPTQDFTSDDVWNYFMIMAENARPAGDVGMPYGDARVTAALALCDYLRPYRDEYRLQKIFVRHDNATTGPSPWLLSIVTRDNREIVWGHAPQAESMGESLAEQKLGRVLAWLKQPEASSAASNRLDVRHASTHSAVSLPIR